MTVSASGPAIDLRGIPCPVNWAHAKVRLEAARRGERLTFLVDDPRSVRDMPRAAEAETYVVLGVNRVEPGVWSIVIEK
jgi:sulfite reductase (ferredoxin)